MPSYDFTLQVRLANDLPRPLTSKAVTAKFLQQGEQVRMTIVP
jgi:hypothetical protein